MSILKQVLEVPVVKFALQKFSRRVGKPLSSSCLRNSNPAGCQRDKVQGSLSPGTMFVTSEP